MTDRNDTFKKFGPILLEACCWVLLDFHNELRRSQGLDEFTMQDILDRLNNHLSELQPYDWMERRG